MSKKSEATGVKVEVEKQVAAIRCLATALRNDAYTAGWKEKFAGLPEILMGTAQQLDGIAYALEHAVNHGGDISWWNKVLAAGALGFLTLVAPNAIGGVMSDAADDLGVPNRLAEMIRDVEDAIGRVDVAIAEAQTPTTHTASAEAHIAMDVTARGEVMTPTLNIELDTIHASELNDPNVTTVNPSAATFEFSDGDAQSELGSDEAVHVYRDLAGAIASVLNEESVHTLKAVERNPRLIMIADLENNRFLLVLHVGGGLSKRAIFSGGEDFDEERAREGVLDAVRERLASGDQ